MEDDSNPPVVNVASVPQRSLFRYPGGKTWLVPRFRAWLQSLPLKPLTLVEPFAGGGIISLTAVVEDLIERAVLVEIEEGVASVWNVLVNGNHKALKRRILSFQITREAVVQELSAPARSDVRRAFQTILRNRVQRGGIIAPGASLVRRGENGKGVASRWYPATLARRIDGIARVRSRLEFHHDNAMRIIPTFLDDVSCAFFVDPPYTAGGKRAGKRLYSHNVVDHEELFRLMSKAAGPVMMTYDDAPEPRWLAERYGFTVSVAPMSNTHHRTLNELIITKT